MKILILQIYLILFCFISSINAQRAAGKIEGSVIDGETKMPLIGANILVMGTALGSSTDAEGKFSVDKVPVGSYSIRFSYIGYQTSVKTDVIVKSGRVAQVYASLQSIPYQTDEVSVYAGYFSKSPEQPVSATGFSYEEIRRAPGSGGDVSRIIMSLPSIAKVNDQANNLAVRGGSPVENAFYVDNIEIPNINHFPTQGASGGPIGLLNLDFINEVDFYAGGFSAAYGNRLSSVMKIAFREGNRDNFEGQLDLNFSGFGGVAEGPLGKNASYMLSVRRSYLDLLVNTINIGTSIVPSYGDYQGKVVCDLNQNNKLIFLGISGDDHNNPDAKTAAENDMVTYGNQDIYENTFGIDWRALWGKNGYSNTSVSYTSSKFNEDSYETGSGITVRKNRSLEESVNLRSIAHYKFDETNSLEFGTDIKRLFDNYNNFYGDNTDLLGNAVPALVNDNKISSTEAGLFVSYIIRQFPRLTATAGIRADYFSYNRSLNYSPRFSASYNLNESNSVNAAVGIYRQNIPLVILSQNPSNKQLKTPAAVHYILGFEHLFSGSAKLDIEAYIKNYKNFPADPAEPDLFLIDELYYGYGFFVNHNALIGGGRARSAGIEITLQKKLVKDFYGLASASFSVSQFAGAGGKWINRIYDNRFVFGIEGGYKPDNQWEFSARWIFAGGTPYTPFDLEKSEALDKAVLDADRVNSLRNPDYHSLNIRADRRFNFTGTNLIIYISIWNVYNRKNVAGYFWNETKNKPGTLYQWGILPIFGVEFEF